jgi:small subunit ribosomal protein S1
MEENQNVAEDSQKEVSVEKASEVAPVAEDITQPAAEIPAEEEEEEKEKNETVPAEKEPPTTVSGPDEDFDWNAYAQGDNYSPSKKEELTKVYDNTLNAIKDKEVVDGIVISINKREVVVNVGYKSDGVVPMSEFRYNPDLKVGDKVEVFIESQEDKRGQLILSHKQARATRSWEQVNRALETQEVTKGYVKCRTKGGMIVDIFGIEAFLPGSQIDVKPIRDYDIFVGKVMEFKVVKINPEFRNVVVSHKALIEAELEQQKKEIISKLEKGQVLEGMVKNITSYGVFIDLGGVDGLIHITDLSWGRVAHPEEIVQLDQKLNVVILDFDDEKKRIALGLKQLSPHPWDALNADLKMGDKVRGKVVVMADYGAFVEIAPGVEGLIHVSEMSWSQHLRSAQDFLKVGDEVESVILTLDREERKMSLGIKQLKEDPWENIEARYPLESKHVAKVRNFTNFGVFVEIEEGVDGLIHISDLSWTKKIKHPSEFTHVGSNIDVMVLEIDKDNRRLSLGHKQLEENPWDVLETVFSVDSIHEGLVIEMMDKGAVIALPYGVEGFATPKHLVKEDGSQARVDEKLEFKVIEFNKDAKRIILSHSRVHEDIKRAGKVEEGNEVAPIAKKVKRAKKEELITPVIEKTTLGDIQELADLKDQLNNEAKEKLEKKAAKAAKAAKVAKKEEAAEDTPKVKKAGSKKNKTEEDAEIKTEVEAEAVAEVEAEAVGEVKAEVVDKGEAEAVAEVEAEVVDKVEAEAVAEVKAEAIAEVKAAVETETEVVAEAETKAVAEGDAEAVAESEV